jgi:RNA 2',3'-cyclic 3'-phosphodiesterase
MIRAFAALALPEPVRFDLALVQQGLPVPRPVPVENMHLTLAFLGEVPSSVLADVDAALGAVRAEPFPLTIAGLDLFGGAKARMVYAGVAASPALVHLQAKVETAARSAGVSLPARRFMPHVTLARLPERLENRERLERAIAMRMGYAGPTFEVEAFHLYRSHLGRGGSVYEELATYPLG